MSTPQNLHIFISPSSFINGLLFLFSVLFPKPKTSITAETHRGKKKTMINRHVPGSSPNSWGECVLISALSLKPHISVLTGGKTDFSTDTRYRQSRNLTLVCTHSTGRFCDSDIHTVFSPASSTAEQTCSQIPSTPRLTPPTCSQCHYVPIEMPLPSLSL